MIMSHTMQRTLVKRDATRNGQPWGQQRCRRASGITKTHMASRLTNARGINFENRLWHHNHRRDHDRAHDKDHDDDYDHGNEGNEYDSDYGYGC